MEREEATTSSQLHNEEEETEEERGAGGKFRKPFLRKPPTTPYDRPSTQTQTRQNQDGGNWWLSKLVDPATRLISNGATRFFPSFFSKPLLTEQLEVKQDAGDKGPEKFHNMARSMEGGQVRLEADISKSDSYVDLRVGGTLHRPSAGTGTSEIEQMLEGKTFSRDDLNRLTEILHSRIAVQSDVDEHGKKNRDATTGANTVDPSLRQENLKAPVDEKEGMHLNRVIGEISTPFSQSTLHDPIGASPIEIAKAYMGTRTSELGLGSQSLALRNERTPLADDFLSKSSIPSPTPKSSICWPGAMVQDQHAYQTPQTERRRVGLHNLPRTPYSRAVHSRSTSKLEGGGDRSRNIFSTNVKQLQTPVYGDSQVTRTRMPSLDDGFGSVGPIRRIRHKFVGTTTPSQGTYSYRPASCGPLADGRFDAFKSLLPMVKQKVEPGASTSSSAKFHPVDTKAPGSVGGSTLHSQSSDMARKILEQLDRTIPTPEKKSEELKLATSWRKSPSSELTTSMLKQPVSDSRVESADPHWSRHKVGKKFFDLGKEVRGSSLPKDHPEQRKPTESTDAVNINFFGTNIVSSEIGSGTVGVQFNAKLSADWKKTPNFQVNTNEVSIGHGERSPSETDHPLPQQNRIGEQVVSRFAHRDPGSKELNVQKKLSTHTFGNKPPLTSIAITKRDPKSTVSFDNGYGFTFPVSASSGALSEPPTPSIMPSFLGTSLRQPEENTTVSSNTSCPKAGDPSYNFGSRTAGRSLVFSFPSSSSSSPSDFSTPKFTFGSDKARLSFRSVGEDAICS